MESLDPWGPKKRNSGGVEKRGPPPPPLQHTHTHTHFPYTYSHSHRNYTVRVSLYFSRGYDGLRAILIHGIDTPAAAET